jgi:hypothetical protein
VAALIASPTFFAGAQGLGREAELERLQARADEAMANGDADGAAMAVGKAALMAAELARDQPGLDARQRYRVTEALLRAQEHTYRAVALFHRAGGQPPASSGVCGSMSLGLQELAKAGELLHASQGSAVPNHQELQASLAQWRATMEGLLQDFQCLSEKGSG